MNSDNRPTAPVDAGFLRRTFPGLMAGRPAESPVTASDRTEAVRAVMDTGVSEEVAEAAVYRLIREGWRPGA